MQPNPAPPDLRPGVLLLVDGQRLARFVRRVDKRNNPDPNGEIVVLQGADGVEFGRLLSQVSPFDRDELCPLAPSLQTWGDYLEERPHRLARAWFRPGPYVPILGDGDGGARDPEGSAHIELRLHERPPAVRVSTVVQDVEHPCRGYVVVFDVLVAWRALYDVDGKEPRALRSAALSLWCILPAEVADLDWSEELERVLAELRGVPREALEGALGPRPAWHDAARVLNPYPERVTGSRSHPNDVRGRRLWELAERAAGGAL